MRHTAQKVFSFGKLQELRAVIPDSGTAVTVEFWSGEQWVEDGNSPISTPDTIYALGVNVRLTPSTGGFFIDEGQST